MLHIDDLKISHLEWVVVKDILKKLMTFLECLCMDACMEATVHIILEGEIAELIAMLEPETFDKYIWCNHKVKAIMYIKLKNPYTELYRQCCYFGNYCPTNYRSGDLRSITMTNVSPIKQSK
jgi:hypothetical protein